MGLSIHAIISLGAAAVVFLFREPLAAVVDERFVEVALLLPLYALLTLPQHVLPEADLSARCVRGICSGSTSSGSAYAQP